MNRKVVIVIIAHNEALRENEKRSLQQCYTVLGSYHTIVICPENMNVSIYKAIHPAAEFMFIDPKWQANYRMFNKLKMDETFYKQFNRFKYVLYYELDAWVFRDELIAWCDKGFDYIGAPWTGLYIYDDGPMTGTGNGGFSLRNIKSTLQLLHKIRMLGILEEYQYFNWRGLLPRIPVLLTRVFRAKRKPGIIETTYDMQEDTFWCKYAPDRLQAFKPGNLFLRWLASLLISNTFRIAPEKDAAAFSFETRPVEMYEINNHRLPFGCHAWEKYDPSFWQPYIGQGAGASSSR